MFPARSKKLELYLRDSSGSNWSLYGSTDLPQDEWVHVAAVRDGNTVTVYVNGESKATDTFTGSVKDSTAPLAIGNYPPQGDNQSFDGLIDEVRISKADRSEELNETTVNYYYNSANQLTKSTSGNWEALYTYDPNGNQTKIVETAGITTLATKTMTYDSFDRMTNWTGPAGTESFAYRGAEWHRKSANGVNFLYDAVPTPEGVNNPLARSPDSSANVLADIVGGSVAKFYVTPFLDEYISVTADSSLHYYSQDERQSIRTLTESTGTVENKYDYTAFGESYAPNTSVTIPQRYTYTGRELNPYSGNLYFRYRSYSPPLGVFTARDPLGYVDGMGLYAGHFSSRIVTDPTGLWKSVAPSPPETRITRDYLNDYTEALLPGENTSCEPPLGPGPGAFTFAATAQATGDNENNIPLVSSITTTGAISSLRSSWDTCHRDVGLAFNVAGEAPDIRGTGAITMSAIPINFKYGTGKGEWMWLKFRAVFLYCPCVPSPVWTRYEKKVFHNGATPRWGGWQLDKGGYGTNTQGVLILYDASMSEPSVYPW